jgi:hypothetical protein
MSFGFAQTYLDSQLGSHTTTVSYLTASFQEKRREAVDCSTDSLIASLGRKIPRFQPLGLCLEKYWEFVGLFAPGLRAT